MERLTFEGNFCDIAMCRENPCPYPDTGCSQKQVWERLKAYEDTGLEPGEIDTLLERYGLLCRAISDETGQPIVGENRIRELAQADKEGRVVVLPCKFSDTIYKIPSKANYGLNIVNRHPENNRVYEQPVFKYEQYRDGSYLLSTCEGLDCVHSDFYGDNWFLTREEAEKALKERADNG